MPQKYKPQRSSFWWISYYQDGKRVRQSLKTRDRKTADYLVAKKEQELAEGTLPPALRKVAFSEALDEYLGHSETYKTKKSHGTNLYFLKAFENAVHPARLKDVSQKVIEDYLVGKVKAKKIKPITANGIARALSAFFGWCVKRRYIAANPTAGLTKFKVPIQPPCYLTEAEVKKLLKESAKSPIYPVVMTALYTGMRRAEIFNLDWRDIDFKAGRIMVLNRDGFTTKSKRFRAIPLSPVLREVLEPIRNESGPCFSNRNFRKEFQNVANRAKLDIGIHALRHTFASHLASKGTSLHVIAKLLGHADTKTTQIYAHLLPESLGSAIENLDFGHSEGQEKK